MSVSSLLSAPVREVTLEGWRAFSDVERSVFVDELLERLPSTVSRLPTEGLLPRLELEGVSFALVPTAPVTVGLTRERGLKALALEGQGVFEYFSPELHLPAWEVSVPMHLTATQSLSEDGRDWFPRYSLQGIYELLEERGWAVPCEAEWELDFWTVRGLTPIAFSDYGELCRDGWASDYSLPFGPDGLTRGEGNEVVRVAVLASPSPSSELPPRRPVRSSPMIGVRPVVHLL